MPGTTLRIRSARTQSGSSASPTCGTFSLASLANIGIAPLAQMRGARPFHETAGHDGPVKRTKISDRTMNDIVRDCTLRDLIERLDHVRDDLEQAHAYELADLMVLIDNALRAAT